MFDSKRITVLFLGFALYLSTHINTGDIISLSGATSLSGTTVYIFKKIHYIFTACEKSDFFKKCQVYFKPLCNTDNLLSFIVEQIKKYVKCCELLVCLTGMVKESLSDKYKFSCATKMSILIG